VSAAQESIWKERGWITEMSVMEMPQGRAMMMSPGASMRTAGLSALMYLVKAAEL
jgi:hypothetical protein